VIFSPPARERNCSATPSPGCVSAELALDRAGFDDASYRTALRDIDAQLVRISKLADTSPELAHEAIAELRTSLRASSDRLDESWKQMLRTLRVEREALAANIAAERGEWSKNQQAVQETDPMVSFDVVRCDVHRVMHRKWGLYMSSKISEAGIGWR